MSDQRAEQKTLHVYYKISFYKYVNNHAVFLAGQYLEEHLLENSEFLTYLAELHLKYNNLEMVNIRIERKRKSLNTEYTHFEIDPMEVIY